MAELIKINDEESTRILRTIAQSVNEKDIYKIYQLKDATDQLLCNIITITKKTEEQILKTFYGEKSEEVQKALKKITEKIAKCMFYREMAQQIEKKGELTPKNPFTKKYEKQYKQVIILSKYLLQLWIDLIEITTLRNLTLKEHWFTQERLGIRTAKPYPFPETTYAISAEKKEEEGDEEDDE